MNSTSLVDEEKLEQFGNEFKSKLAEVATSGSYNDLSDKPEIPNDLITYGTEDLTPGVSTLKTGTLYIVYE